MTQRLPFVFTSARQQQFTAHRRYLASADAAARWVPQTSDRLRAGWPERQDHTDVWGEGAMIAANSSGGRRLRLLIDTLVWYSRRP